MCGSFGSVITIVVYFIVAKGFELRYQPDDEREIVRDLLYDMTNRVICEVDHTADKTGIRKCRPGIACCFFKKFYRINRPPTPVLKLKNQRRSSVSKETRGKLSISTVAT